MAAPPCRPVGGIRDISQNKSTDFPDISRYFTKQIKRPRSRGSQEQTAVREICLAGGAAGAAGQLKAAQFCTGGQFRSEQLGQGSY
jgi:hypothetical protein